MTFLEALEKLKNKQAKFITTPSIRRWQVYYRLYTKGQFTYLQRVDIDRGNIVHSSLQHDISTYTNNDYECIEEDLLNPTESFKIFFEL